MQMCFQMCGVDPRGGAGSRLGSAVGTFNTLQVTVFLSCVTNARALLPYACSSTGVVSLVINIHVIFII